MQTKGGKEDPKAKLLESPKEQEAAFRKYCLDLLEDRSPDNLYYPFNKLEKRLRIYYEVEENLDGEVTLGELVKLCRTKDPKFAESLERTFYKDLARGEGDAKISLAIFLVNGLIGAEYDSEYAGCRKIE